MTDTPHYRDVFDRRLMPLLHADEHQPPAKASLITVEPCPVQFARAGIAAWHSRLPRTQPGSWMLAFAAHYQYTCFGTALWSNPSTPSLPADWLELRRLAVGPEAPHCTASRMLGQMTRWIKQHRRDVPMLVSYQDQEVHTGTIYRAAGWYPAAEKPFRVDPRKGPGRLGRTNLNGDIPETAAKTRWQLALPGSHPKESAVKLPAEQQQALAL